MKRFLSVLLLVCLLMTAAAPALAAALPTVSFRTESGAVNGGCAYELIVKVNQAQTEDLPVQIKNGATGEVLNTVSLKQTTEASPIAFGNHILLGTRSAMYLFEIQ